MSYLGNTDRIHPNRPKAQKPTAFDVDEVYALRQKHPMRSASAVFPIQND